MTLLINNSIWYAFYSKLVTFRDFEKNSRFFSKNPSIFSKDPNFEILLFQSFDGKSTANLLQFGQKIISRSVAWTNLPMWRERNWQTSGKKKRRKWPIWEEGFAFIFLRIWRKITIFLTETHNNSVIAEWIELFNDLSTINRFCSYMNIFDRFCGRVTEAENGLSAPRERSKYPWGFHVSLKNSGFPDKKLVESRFFLVQNFLIFFWNLKKVVKGLFGTIYAVWESP